MASCWSAFASVVVFSAFIIMRRSRVFCCACSGDVSGATVIFMEISGSHLQGLGTGVVAGDEGSARLDRVLAVRLPELSRSRLKALILAGQVTIGQTTTGQGVGAAVRDPAYHVGTGETITIDVPEAAPAEPEAEDIPLAIVYEDDDIIVLDKPAGLVVHPASGHETGTLGNALIAHCGTSLSGIGGVKRPGIVHRLDKDTSGLLVVAKNDLAHQGLAEQFADRGRTGPLERLYLALVWGVPERRRGTGGAARARGRRGRGEGAGGAGGGERGRGAGTQDE